MSAGTKIEWTETTWNPLTGCTRVSDGCTHCYIERTPPFRMAGRKFDKAGTGGATGIMLHPERLKQPLRWRKPRRVFVNSLSDLFHEQVADEYIARVFAVMAVSPQHTYQLLTKRAARMRALLSDSRWLTQVGDAGAGVGLRDVRSLLDGAWPLRNVWLGVSVESQQWADIRIPALLDTPAAVRWISAEPLLGPVDLSKWLGPVDWPTCWSGHLTSEECPNCIQLEWVVAGGESGPGSRPVHPMWIRSLRDQCGAAGVPFFMKQWGEWVTEDQAPEDILLPATSFRLLGDDGPSFWRVGKHAAGRGLDGCTHDEYPAAVR